MSQLQFLKELHTPSSPSHHYTHFPTLVRTSPILFAAAQEQEQERRFQRQHQRRLALAAANLGVKPAPPRKRPLRRRVYHTKPAAPGKIADDASKQMQEVGKDTKAISQTSESSSLVRLLLFCRKQDLPKP